MREELCFVQFLHPGGEHRPDAQGLKYWNLGDHKRKFLRVRGRWIDSSNALHDDELVFWGEWESPSWVVSIENPLLLGPRFIHAPFLPEESPSGWRQNTDPFVFGDRFQYTGCLQRTKFGPTQLMFLKQGSVILFGSRVGGSAFALDTVFVVDRHLDHSRANLDEIRRQVSPAYIAATLDPWYSDGSSTEVRHRLYFGANADDPVEGMFSFFPALPVERAPHGFPRPTIDLWEAITPTMTQGKRLNKQTNFEDVHQLWERVVEQVRAHGLELGVYAQPPAVEKSARDPRATSRSKC